MIGRLFRALALLSLALAAPLAAKAPAKPRLVVTLVVDQFAADLFERYRPTYVAGLKRLADGVTAIRATRRPRPARAIRRS